MKGQKESADEFYKKKKPPFGSPEVFSRVPHSYKDSGVLVVVASLFV